jgi:hypothetical protein
LAAALWLGAALAESVVALLALELPEPSEVDVSRDDELGVELGWDETGEPSE